MSNLKWSWQLTEGYSELVKGARVDVLLKKGPASLKLDAPIAFLRKKRPVEFEFSLKKTLMARGPGSVSVRLGPRAWVRSRILFPGNAFLGNFRVPKDRVAVQWDVEGTVTASAGRSRSFLIQVDIGKRLRQTWVTILPTTLPLAQALQEAWKGYCDPSRSESIAGIRDGQIIRVTASGRLRLRLNARWGLSNGWTIPDGIPLLSSGLVGDARAEASFRLERSGRFYLQVSRRRDLVRFSLRRTSEKVSAVRAAAGVYQSSSFRVRPLRSWKPELGEYLVDPLSQPLSRKVNRKLREVLAKKLETSIVVEAQRSRGRATILRASWSNLRNSAFNREYARLLEGRLLRPRDGFKLSGSVSRALERSLSVEVHVLNWLAFSASRERREETRLSITPDGNLLLEEGRSLEKRWERWGDIQFLQLLHQTSRKQEQQSEDIRWSYGREGKLERKDITKFLRLALFSSAIASYSVPSGYSHPVRVRLSWVTDFSPVGFQKIRVAEPETAWASVVRAMELCFPERYSEDSVWRDWIDDPEVRFCVDREPVQSHLASKYPVPGRSLTQRRHITSTYRKIRYFLDLFQAWQEGAEDPFKVFRLGMDLPVFVFFHLLCPQEFRNSTVVSTGGFEQVWGSLTLATINHG